MSECNNCDDCPKKRNSQSMIDKTIVTDEVAKMYANRLKHYCEEHSNRHDDCKECIFRRESKSGMDYYCVVNFPCDWWLG